MLCKTNNFQVESRGKGVCSYGEEGFDDSWEVFIRNSVNVFLSETVGGIEALYLGEDYVIKQGKLLTNVRL